MNDTDKTIKAMEDAGLTVCDLCCHWDNGCNHNKEPNGWHCDSYDSSWLDQFNHYR
jgi:hypothetical protein